MAYKFISIGAFLGALSVILGAFAAHTLKNHLSPDQIEIFQTGVRYQFYHTFAILILGAICLNFPHRFFKYSFIAFLIGIICFSGSLYLLATRFVMGIDSWNWLGPVTPLGGLFLIIGWVFMLIGALKIRTLDK
jgi:uncharacterized membrane protein YgdD (TMEM256/DUF423 family)